MSLLLSHFYMEQSAFLTSKIPSCVRNLNLWFIIHMYQWRLKKRERENKQHRTFSHTLSQLNLTIPSWKIPQSNPLSSHSLSLFWLVTIVNVWCGCHYLQHWLRDLTSSSWSLPNNGFELYASPACQHNHAPVPRGLSFARGAPWGSVSGNLSNSSCPLSSSQASNRYNTNTVLGCLPSPLGITLSSVSEVMTQFFHQTPSSPRLTWQYPEISAPERVWDGSEIYLRGTQKALYSCPCFSAWELPGT